MNEGRGGWLTNWVEVEHCLGRERQRGGEGGRSRERRRHERGTISPRREGGESELFDRADPLSYVVVPAPLLRTHALFLIAACANSNVNYLRKSSHVRCVGVIHRHGHSPSWNLKPSSWLRLYRRVPCSIFLDFFFEAGRRRVRCRGAWWCLCPWLGIRNVRDEASRPFSQLLIFLISKRSVSKTHPTSTLNLSCEHRLGVSRTGRV